MFSILQNFRILEIIWACLGTTQKKIIAGKSISRVYQTCLNMTLWLEWAKPNYMSWASQLEAQAQKQQTNIGDVRFAKNSIGDKIQTMFQPVSDIGKFDL